MKRLLQTAVLATAACAALTVAPHIAAAGMDDHPNIHAGNWEMTMKTEFEGMPAMPGGMPSATIKRCVKASDTQSNKSFAELMSQHGGQCSYSDFKGDASKISYSFTCKDGLAGDTEILFGGDTYEVTTHALVPPRSKQPARKMTQHMTAKRIGDC